MFLALKQAHRREADIAIVTSAFLVEFEDLSQSPPIVRSIRMSFGGMAPTTVMATKTMKECVGKYDWIVLKFLFCKSFHST